MNHIHGLRKADRGAVAYIWDDYSMLSEPREVPDAWHIPTSITQTAASDIPTPDLNPA